MAIEIQPAAFNRKQAAQYLGISENTLVKLLNSGKIRFVKAESRLIIPKVELDKFLSGDQPVLKTTKEKVMAAYEKDGYIGALKAYRFLTDSCLKDAVDTVKPWCIEWGYDPYRV